MKASEVTRIWLPAKHPRVACVRRAFEWLDAQTKEGAHASLIARAKADLYPHSYVADVLGERAVNDLRAGRWVPLPRGGRLSLINAFGNRPFRFEGCAVVIMAEPKLLNFVDSMTGLRGIFVVTADRADGAAWADQWRAIEDGAGLPPPRSAPLGPVVVRGMRSYFILVGMHSHLRPKDRSLAADTLYYLRDHGETFTPAQVRSWVATLPDGTPDLADGLAAVAERVLSGRERRSDRCPWSELAIVKWRAEAQSDDSDA